MNRWTACCTVLLLVCTWTSRGQEYKTDMDEEVDSGLLGEVLTTPLPILKIGEVGANSVQVHIYHKKYHKDTQVRITYVDPRNETAVPVEHILTLDNRNQTHTFSDLLVDQEYRVCAEASIQGQRLEERCYTLTTYDSTSVGLIVGVCVAVLLVLLAVFVLVYKLYLQTKIKSWTVPKRPQAERPEPGHVNHKSTQLLVQNV